MLRAVKLLESHIGKRKLVVCFGVVIILGIAFLYYENVYNLNNRFKPFSTLSIDPDTSSHKTHQSNGNQNKLASKLEIEKDNTNYINHSKCWQNEKFSIVQECKKCDPLYLKYLSACRKTGFIETLNCSKYGNVSRDCPVPDSVLIHQYWSFEFICLVLMGMFSSFVVNRKKFLDMQAMERMRQQIND